MLSVKFLQSLVYYLKHYIKILYSIQWRIYEFLKGVDGILNNPPETLERYMDIFYN